MSKREVQHLVQALVSVLIFVLGALLFTDETQVKLPIPEDDAQMEVSKEDGVVQKIVDGDTLDVMQAGEVVRVRLIGIDTPETVDPRKPVQCFGAEASQHVKDLLADNLVTLEFDESQGSTDKYGRTLAYVILPDGKNLAEEMLRDGFAYEYTYSKPYKYQKIFKIAEQDARDSERGLWSSETCGGNR